ncbi:hypothetical protein RCL1_001022 [Eukaryota sp. TZLM3-RCL]
MLQKHQKVGIRRIPAGFEERVDDDTYELCEFLTHDEVRNVWVCRSLDSKGALIQGDDFVEFSSDPNWCPKEEESVFAIYPGSNFLARAHVVRPLSQKKFLVHFEKDDAEVEIGVDSIAKRERPSFK